MAIRVPVGPLKETGILDSTDYSNVFKNQITQTGEKVAIMGLGNFYSLAEEVAAELKNNYKINATIINPKFISGLDTKLLDHLQENHQIVVTLEDGIVDGGYGQTVAGYLGDTSLNVQNYGLEKAFHDRYGTIELMAESGLTVENIVKNITDKLSLY